MNSGFTMDDLADTVSGILFADIHPPLPKLRPASPPFPGSGRNGVPGENSREKRKIFVSDYELRKYYYKEGAKDVVLPSNVIISPLTAEWMALKGVKIVVK